MFVVLGASGHTGRVAAKGLLERGQKVRVVGRSAERLQDLASQGAEVFLADVTDGPALSKAFRGADAAYVMVPPNSTSNDYRAYQERVSDAIAAAVQNSGLKRVVALSSFGADKASGTGPVAGLHNLEEKLAQVEGANVLNLRAGYFMENTLPQVAVVRMMGSMAGPVRPELKLPMIATRDIGDAVAKALLEDFRAASLRWQFLWHAARQQCFQRARPRFQNDSFRRRYPPLYFLPTAELRRRNRSDRSFTPRNGWELVWNGRRRGFAPRRNLQTDFGWCILARARLR